MALPDPTSPWTNGKDLSSRLCFGFGGEDYERYEADGEFVLTVEMPGFEPEEMDPEASAAQYRNGVLEVRLPVLNGGTRRGHTIEVESGSAPLFYPNPGPPTPDRGTARTRRLRTDG